MSIWDQARDFAREFLSLATIQPVQTRQTPEEILVSQIAALRTNTSQPWRLPSISEALSVPAIQRAVTLISNTTGSLSMQGFRNGALMDETPRIIARPDPYETPRDAYRDMGWNMATRGETVLWIARRDTDNLASALVNVPLNELRVENNPRNRLFPVYTWGTLQGTRYSPANPTGEFVHITYVKEPGELRGKGPLQLCGAAVSVSVEAQLWAANFYADGGSGGTLIKAADYLDATLDADGLAEADKLRAQWVNKPNNVPRVIDPRIESVDYQEPSVAGAQMLEARNWQTGEAARMYGMPGKLLEYSAAGSSLTYQNLTEVFTEFVKTCLAPNYLEPIEQAMSDLLPRSTAARFNVKGFLRADIKTRFEVYGLGITNGIITAEQAAAEEGYLPGDVEFAPVLPAPPQAVPERLPETRSAELRCNGMAQKRRAGVTRIETCGKLLSTTGTFTGMCPRCHKVYPAAA